MGFDTVIFLLLFYKRSFLLNDRLHKSSYTLITNGEILIGMDGEFNAARWKGGDALLNQRVCKVNCDLTKIDDSYLLHFLPAALKRIEDATPFVTVKHLSVKSINDIDICLPPLAEQKRIAAILDKADEIRRKRQQTIAKLDQLAQSIFVEMFGDVATNKGWEVQNLSAVTTFENGDRSSNYPSGDDIKSSGILFLSTKNIVNDKLDLSTTSFITEEKFNSLSRGKVKQNDLIITLRGTLGSCCIFDSEHKTAFINAQMMIIRPQESVLAPYLHAFLTSTRCKQHLQNIGNGAAVPQLTSKQFSVLALPVPPLALQEQFANRINKLEQQKADQVTALAKQNQLFASLQHQAFTGQL